MLEWLPKGARFVRGSCLLLVVPNLFICSLLVDSAAEAALRDFTISDGTPVEIPDRDLKITPPVGWQILRNVPNMTLMLRDPGFDAVRQLRTLQVVTRTGPKYMDEMTAESFSEDLVNHFTGASAAVVGYRIRNYNLVDLADGNRGILFYAEYGAHGVALMHMHLLTSSRSNHYLLTYNDLAENFQTDNAMPIDALAQAWQSMISIQLDSHAPTRFQRWFQLIYIAFGLFALLFTLRRIKGYIAKRQYSKFAESHDLSDVELDADEKAYRDGWRLAEASKTASYVEEDLEINEKDVS